MKTNDQNPFANACVQNDCGEELPDPPNSKRYILRSRSRPILARPYEQCQITKAGYESVDLRLNSTVVDGAA
jgi:hypothetical protein